MKFNLPTLPQAFQIMLKPAGPLCNLNCTYCYYLEKWRLYPGEPRFRLAEDLLEKFIREYIEAQDVPLVVFVWQGGEPALLGVDYYRKAVALQNRYKGSKRIENAFQTNGTLLTDEFCQFFNDNHFLVGISIDGPERLHDSYRLDKNGKPTWRKVMQGVNLLQKHGVQFNTLSVVNNKTSHQPIKIYKFLKEIGSTFLQFIPVVERSAKKEAGEKMHLVHQKYAGSATLTQWSVSARQYGIFLNSIYREWVRRDVGRYFVQIFDATLANYINAIPGMCIFNDTCGNAAVMEHNGDVFSCDHYVYEDHFLGNLNEATVKNIIGSTAQFTFGQSKKTELPSDCIACEYAFACHGGCPKHRFIPGLKGEAGQNYLCEGYKMFFRYSKPTMKYMANELKAQRPPANVMKWIGEKGNPGWPLRYQGGLPRHKKKK